jgi:hypothetical protein
VKVKLDGGVSDDLVDEEPDQPAPVLVREFPSSPMRGDRPATPRCLTAHCHAAYRHALARSVPSQQWRASRHRQEGRSLMAFSDFVSCCSSQGQAFADGLLNLGEDIVTGFLSVWKTLPRDSQLAIIAAAEAGATALGGALAAAGITGGEALAAFLIGFGIGASIAIMVSCSSNL